jgi:hypothetical protein
VVVLVSMVADILCDSETHTRTMKGYRLFFLKVISSFEERDIASDRSRLVGVDDHSEVQI